MSDLVLDTHASIWYFSNARKLSATAKASIDKAFKDGNTIFMPTISIVEIIYLVEKRKLLPQTLPSLIHALNLPNNSFSIVDLTTEIAENLAKIPRSIVPDMPDRIITATALTLNLPLITADHKIQAVNLITTIW
jgi:PIN domain nuclease of toxin-antitoxin system